MLFSVHNLRASRVNLLMNDFAAGLPSPLAFLGLGAAIAPTLDAPRWGIGVLPILHRVDISEGRSKAEAAPARKSGVFAPIEIPEDLVGSVEISLLLDVPGCSDEHRVTDALLGRRIAGGAINNLKINVVSVATDGSAFKGMSRGYAMIRTEPPKCHLVATGGFADLTALAAELYPAERELGAGWHIPVAVGHRLLEDIETVPKRANTRAPNIPHVFTEPAVGIAELVSVRNKRLTEHGVHDLLWRWTAEGNWIVGHPNYHPNRRMTVKQENIDGQN